MTLAEVIDAPEPPEIPSVNGSLSESPEAKPSTDPNGNATKNEPEDYMDSLEAIQPPSVIPSIPNITNTLHVAQESTEAIRSGADSSEGELISPNSVESAQARQSRSFFRNANLSASKHGDRNDATPELARQPAPSSTAAPSSPGDHTSSITETSVLTGDRTSSTRVHTSSDSTTTTHTHTVNNSFFSRISSSFSGPNSATSSVSLPHPPSVPPVPTGGESIYRTIMNRLTALESNHTLYARYVEEQTAGVRETLKKLGEEVGRLEGIVNLSLVVKATMCSRLIASGEGSSTNVSTHHQRMGKTKATAGDGTRGTYVTR